MPVVKFNEVEGFVRELKEDAAMVERSIVRVVFRTRTDATYPQRSLSVVASFVAGGNVVTLEHRVGSFFDGTDEAGRVRAAAEEVAEMVRACAAAAGLVVRGGVFEAV